MIDTSRNTFRFTIPDACNTWVHTRKRVSYIFLGICYLLWKSSPCCDKNIQIAHVGPNLGKTYVPPCCG